MNTATATLVIVQCGEIVAECTAPWYKTLREEFEREYEWYRHQDSRTAMVEASDEDEAIAKYHEEIDASEAYFNTL